MPVDDDTDGDNTNLAPRFVAFVGVTTQHDQASGTTGIGGYHLCNTNVTL